MNTLSKEMKAELAEKKANAEIAARIRAGQVPAPKPQEPQNRAIKVLSEAPIDFYKSENRVSADYEVWDCEPSIAEMQNQPRVKPRQFNPNSQKEFSRKVQQLVEKFNNR